MKFHRATLLISSEGVDCFCFAFLVSIVTANLHDFNSKNVLFRIKNHIRIKSVILLMMVNFSVRRYLFIEFPVSQLYQSELYCNFTSKKKPVLLMLIEGKK